MKERRTQVLILAGIALLFVGSILLDILDPGAGKIPALAAAAAGEAEGAPPEASLSVIEQARRDLPSPDPLLRRRAILILSRAGAADLPEIVRGGLADPDTRIQEASLQAAAGVPDPVFPSREIVLLLSSPDPAVRAAAERTLASAGGRANVSPFLHGAMGSSDPDLAGRALRIASARYAREGIEAASVIRTALRHPQKAVKAEALRFLARLSPGEVSANFRTEVEALSQEADETLRSLAAGIQAKLG